MFRHADDVGLCLVYILWQFSTNIYLDAHFICLYIQSYIKIQCVTLFIFWWHLFMSLSIMPFYYLYLCSLYLDVQLLESNFKHFNWHHMLHSFYRVV